jgi:hypothetical protein
LFKYTNYKFPVNKADIFNALISANLMAMPAKVVVKTGSYYFLMLAHSGNLSDSAEGENPPAPLSAIFKIGSFIFSLLLNLFGYL